MTATLWLQYGRHRGDNAQLDALGALVRERLAWKTVPLFSETVPAPPWPDAIAGVGYRTVKTALEIKKAAANRTRAIRLGRPRHAYRAFDLIVTTNQYGLPPAPHLLTLTVPLAQRVGTVRDPSLVAGLSSPYHLLIIGGPSKTVVYDRPVLDRLLAAAETHRKERGGSLLIVTSPRTPGSLSAALEQAGKDSRVWQWQPSGDNPYRDLLALADDVLCNGDSASLMADVLRQGKPLYLQRPTNRRSAITSVDGLWDRARHRAKLGRMPDALDEFIYFLGREGVLTSRRRMDWLTDDLIDAGYAGELGKSSPSALPPFAEEEAMLLKRLAILCPPTV
ncbi:MAG TPA: ELM1/GtrOC1 family putative glycosyltransferase [Dongiaceae bacterium]|jgi:hypothetical protein|nr:ELM1/GtrOC1 family putative glycosyltransferase [Dongiaceae bacterium]